MAENKPQNGGQTAKKVLGIVGFVLAIMFFIVCLFGLILSISSKKDKDGAATLFGYQMRIVLTSSMEASEETDVSAYKIKSIKAGSMVFIKTVPTEEEDAEKFYSELNVGDVLTFVYRYDTAYTITHRIVDIITPAQRNMSILSPEYDEFILENPEYVTYIDGQDGYVIFLDGDNKNGTRYEGDVHSNSTAGQQIIDTADSPEESLYKHVIGKVFGVSYVVGVVVGALKTPLGIGLIIILPCLIIIVYELIRIAGAVNEDKRRKDKEIQEKQSDEIADLKRQIAELEKKADKTNSGVAEKPDSETTEE